MKFVTVTLLAVFFCLVQIGDARSGDLCISLSDYLEKVEQEAKRVGKQGLKLDALSYQQQYASAMKRLNDEYVVMWSKLHPLLISDVQRFVEITADLCYKESSMPQALRPVPQAEACKRLREAKKSLLDRCKKLRDAR